MGYRTLYRAWRPQTFDQVLGQDHVCRTLKNAITHGRLAHAYLFCGPRGTGKTSTAKILAKALNCIHGPTPEPCDECDLCVRIREGFCLDVLEMDAASNRGIDEIRSLRDQIRLTPTEGRYKVYIIDEVHMLTTEAFNAFLKTLEEPPPRVLFILATTEPERIPATIMSRCQRFDFHRLTTETIAGRLEEIGQEEGLTLEPRTAMLLARTAQGSLRDGLGLLDQCISFCGPVISHHEALELLGIPAGDSLTNILEAIGKGDAGQVLTILAGLREAGQDPHLLLKHLTFWLRNLLLLKVCREPGQLLELSEEEINDLKGQSDLWHPDQITSALTKLTDQETNMRFAAQPWIIVEATLTGLSLGGSHPVKEIKAEVAVPSATSLPVEKTDLPAELDQSGKQYPKTSQETTKAPPVPTTADEGSVDVSQVQAAWPEILQQVRTQGPALEAVWRYGEPVQINEKGLQVVFGAEGIKNVASQPDKVKALQDALCQVLGKEFAVRPVTAVPDLEPEPRTQDEPLGITEAKNLFGADMVVISEFDKER